MKKILSLVISVAILAFMYWKIGPEDRARLLEIFRNADSLWMVLSLAMVVPLTLFTSWRLQQLMPSADQLPLGEANKLILVASVLNLILPSKMGDIAKAYFLRDRGHLNGSLALSLVVFEKSCDMLSLLLWCVFGLFLYPQKDGVFWTMTTAVAVMLVLGCLLLGSKPFARFFFQLADRFAPRKIKARVGQLAGSWEEMHDYFWASKARLFKVTATSVFVWFLHLLQIWMFILALRGHVFFLENPAFARLHFVESLALSPLALLAGLLPV
ncbi:MAG: lysylphosphatidylglycerol synthase transmembrane domain-containing protein, partial [Verrucomicrobiota bacterium]